MDKTEYKTYKNFIDGQWVDPDSNAFYQVYNPAKKTEIVGSFPLSNESDVEKAVQAAHRPDLDHGRRRDDSRMSGVLGRGLVDVDRVLVADRVEPVVDHRLVDRMTARARLALSLGLDLLRRRADVVDRAHGCPFFAQALITAEPSAPSGPMPRPVLASPR